MSEASNLRFDFGRQRKFRRPQWVPLAGGKRKAPDDRLADDYDAPPSKQFAVDDEVESEIVKDGYLMSDPGLGGGPPAAVVHDVTEMEDGKDEDFENHTATRHTCKKAKRRLEGRHDDDTSIDTGATVQKCDGSSFMETAN